MGQPEDEFYVGYLARSPRGIAIFTRGTVAVLLALGLGVGLLLVTGQGPFDAGSFEYGVERSFEGLLLERPYPILLVPAAGDPVTHHLVGTGKHGAEGLVAGMDGKAVRVLGSLIRNPSLRMIDARRIEPLDAARAAEFGALARHDEHPLGTMTLVGEIVDSKCHLGVMKPGRGKPHKACAIRCISGGVPPLLRVEGHDGAVVYFQLVGLDGRPVNREVLDLVAEPVEITGPVTRSRDLLVLHAEPATYLRIE